MAASTTLTRDQRVERAKRARAAQSTVDYHIRKLVDAAPPLTQAQRDRLASLLRPSPSHEREAA